MSEIISLENIEIKKLIYEVRGKQVMLDSDIAILYGVETKRINEAVKNNPLKFPDRYSFKLTDVESYNFLVENFDQKIEKRGGKYKNPRVFTEQGVAMLATILKSDLAVRASIAIMDAFVLMRKYIVSDANVRISNIETKLIEHDNKINKVFDLLDNKTYNHIFFEGQIYDAYSLMMDILNQAKQNIIIIDNYIDKKLLDILSKVKKKIIIITKKIETNDLEKYNLQYHNIYIEKSNAFHDRFIILDKKILYHSGASFKDLGNKCFAITKIEDASYLNMLLAELKK